MSERPLDGGLEGDADQRKPEDIADLARSANGLGDVDPEEMARSLLTAQLDVMNTMVAASMNVTATSMKAMAQLWSFGLPKVGTRRDEKD